MESNNLSPVTYPKIVPTHSGDSRNKATPFAHRELKKSLEAIVSDPETSPRRPVLEEMFSDKAKTLKASVNAVGEYQRLLSVLFDQGC